MTIMEAASGERIRLLAVELAGLQEAGDLIASERAAAGGQDVPLEALLLRLARARERLMAAIERDR